jgi:regulator of replication initiation timing
MSKLFHAEQFNNYSTLVEIRDNPNTSAMFKLKAAQDMLDRSMGRATQRVEISHETVSENPVEEYNRLEAENQRLRKELGSAEDIRETK